LRITLTRKSVILAFSVAPVAIHTQKLVFKRICAVEWGICRKMLSRKMETFYREDRLTNPADLIGYKLVQPLGFVGGLVG